MFSEGRGSLLRKAPFCPDRECSPHYKLYFLTALHWQHVCRVLLNLRHESADCVLRDLPRILGAACVTRWGREPGDTPRHLDSIPAFLSLTDRPSEHSCAFSKTQSNHIPLTPITQPPFCCRSAHNTVIDYLHIGRRTEWRECISLSM